jgi:hypothetical protein
MENVTMKTTLSLILGISLGLALTAHAEDDSTQRVSENVQGAGAFFAAPTGAGGAQVLTPGETGLLVIGPAGATGADAALQSLPVPLPAQEVGPTQPQVVPPGATFVLKNSGLVTKNPFPLPANKKKSSRAPSAQPEETLQFEIMK